MSLNTKHLKGEQRRIKRKTHPKKEVKKLRSKRAAKKNRHVYIYIYIYLCYLKTNRMIVFREKEKEKKKGIENNKR